MALAVKLEVFEGPLDLLLHLIDKNKIDIYDIPIVVITEQYMEYIRQLETEDMNVMSEFLLMAATLLDIKCRMLLPKEVSEDGEEEDPREELVQKLLEYKIDPIRSQFGKIEKDEINVDEKMVYIQDYIRNHKKFSFRMLLEKSHNKMEIVITFLTILEMMKMGQITIEQDNLFDDIIITSKEAVYDMQ